ncbi:hypothetical protein MRX96_019078 [Rhipicephalus microplus]
MESGGTLTSPHGDNETSLVHRDLDLLQSRGLRSHGDISSAYFATEYSEESNERGQDEPKQRPDKRTLIDPVRVRLSRQKAHSQDLRCHDVTARLPNRSAHDRMRPPVSMCPDSPTVPGPPRGRGKPWRQPVAKGPGTH